MGTCGFTGVTPWVILKHMHVLCVSEESSDSSYLSLSLPSLSRVFADAQTMLTYGGNNSFTGFTGLQQSLERLGERPGAWPSRSRTQTAWHP